MLPATKAVPKEMLPIVDKPLIQYAVEEAAASGIDQIVLVTGPDRAAVRQHFGGGSNLARIARLRGDENLLAQAEAPEQLADFQFVEQPEPVGIADAVKRAQPLLEDEPFVLMFPDDLVLAPTPCAAQLLRAREACGAASIVAVRRVAPHEISQYGIVDPDGADSPARLRAIVEKPASNEAPSDLGVVGRYVLDPSIFRHIDGLEPGVGGELQLTDALAGQIAAGDPVYAYRFEGQRYDTGRPAGAVAATVAMALEREELRSELLAQLDTLIPTER